jgi:hypothetical protein
VHLVSRRRDPRFRHGRDKPMLLCTDELDGQASHLFVYLLASGPYPALLTIDYSSQWDGDLTELPRTGSSDHDVGLGSQTGRRA